MKGDGLIVVLGLVGVGVLIYLVSTNQIGPVSVAAAAPGMITTDTSGAADVCPGGPGC